MIERTISDEWATLKWWAEGGDPILFAGRAAAFKAVQENYAALKAENDRLRTFASQLSRIQFEEWHGHYQDGEFWIFDSEGEGIAKGKDAFEAWQNMERAK